MANQVSFQRLVEAIANAVTDAQHRLSQHKINNIRGFFDDNNRPVSVDIRTPSILPDAQRDQDGNWPDDIHQIPLITMVNNRQLSIKDLVIDFEANLGGLTSARTEGGGRQRSFAEKLRGEARQQRGDDDEQDTNHPWLSSDQPDEMTVDPEPDKTDGRGPTARITVRVEAEDPPEGYARLIDRLIKTI